MDKSIKAFEDWWESRDKKFNTKNLCIQAFHLGECVEAMKDGCPLYVDYKKSCQAFKDRKIELSRTK